MSGRWYDAVLAHADGTVEFGPDPYADHDEAPDLTDAPSRPGPPKVCSCPILRACCVAAEYAAIAAADAWHAASAARRAENTDIEAELT